MIIVVDVIIQRQCRRRWWRMTRRSYSCRRRRRRCRNGWRIIADGSASFLAPYMHILWLIMTKMRQCRHHRHGRRCNDIISFFVVGKKKNRVESFPQYTPGHSSFSPECKVFGGILFLTSASTVTLRHSMWLDGVGRWRYLLGMMSSHLMSTNQNYSKIWCRFNHRFWLDNILRIWHDRRLTNHPFFRTPKFVFHLPHLFPGLDWPWQANDEADEQRL